jgi:hypothetical protein
MASPDTVIEMGGIPHSGKVDQENGRWIVTVTGESLGAMDEGRFANERGAGRRDKGGERAMRAMCTPTSTLASGPACTATCASSIAGCSRDAGEGSVSALKKSLRWIDGRKSDPKVIESVSCKQQNTNQQQ